MPISPENRRRYPKDWKAIRAEVLERATVPGTHHMIVQCEGSPAYPDCDAVNGDPHPVTGSRVVLTVGHLNHHPEHNGIPGDRPNLRAWCQRCHNTYDQNHRITNARARRRRALNNLELFPETGPEGPQGEHHAQGRPTSTSTGEAPSDGAAATTKS